MCHLLTLQTFTPKQKLLFETAEHLYGKKFRELQAKPCADFVAGEAILEEKAIVFFQKQMEHFHHSVAHLAFNMGKLAGVCLFVFLKIQLY